MFIGLARNFQSDNLRQADHFFGDNGHFDLDIQIAAAVVIILNRYRLFATHRFLLSLFLLPNIGLYLLVNYSVEFWIKMTVKYFRSNQTHLCHQ